MKDAVITVSSLLPPVLSLSESSSRWVSPVMCPWGIHKLQKEQTGYGLCPHGGWCSPHWQIQFWMKQFGAALTHSTSQPAQQHVGAGYSVPAHHDLFPWIFWCRKKIQGHSSICMRRHHSLFKVILGHTTIVVKKTGCRARIACQSPSKSETAGWLFQLSASLREASYSSESHQLS